jgi:hypothetical protein
LYKIYNYEKENHKHGNTCSYVCHFGYGLCRETYGTPTAAAGSAGTTAATVKVIEESL